MMRKKLMMGLLMIGLISTAAGAGTLAYFSDTESSTDNTLTAGTLDLNIDGGDSATTTLTVTDVAPGDTGEQLSTISNAGTIDGYVDVEVPDTISNNEGANPESETGDTSDPGELGDVANVTIYIDDDGDLGSDSDQTTVVSTTNGLNNLPGDYEVDHSLPAGQSSNLVIEYIVPSGAGNDIQGDISSFDVKVKLDQTTGQ